MKTLKFKGFKAQWILDGTKTATMRLFDDKDLQVGDELELINSDSGKIFSKAVITEILYKKVVEVEDVDLEGHEKWDSREEMFDSLRKYYGDKVDSNTEVKIVRFKLVQE
jgi:hypothetical protein